MKDRRHHRRDHRREHDDAQDCVQEKKHFAGLGLHVGDGSVPRQDEPGIEQGVRPAEVRQVPQADAADQERPHVDGCRKRQGP